MKINFTKKQYARLIKSVYLANWMANAHITDDDRIKEYDELEEYILSFAKDFELDEYVDDEEMRGRKYFPSRHLEEETDVFKVIDEYDNNTFWDEIADRLGERDFCGKYDEKEINEMSQKERFVKLRECVDKWEEEASNYGIDRLEIKEEK